MSHDAPLPLPERLCTHDQRETFLCLMQQSSEFIGMADPEDGRLMCLNPVGRRLIGLSVREDVAGIRMHDYVAPDSLALFQDTVRPTVLATGQWSGEMRLRHVRSGAEIEAECSAFLVQDAAGQTSGVGLIVRTMDDRTGTETSQAGEHRLRAVLHAADMGTWIDQQAAASLHDREEQLRAMFDQAGVGIAVIDRDGGFVDVNDCLCAILGRRRGDLVKTTCGALTHPDDRGRHARLMDDVVAGRCLSLQMEQRYAKPDGSWTWVHVSISPVRVKAGDEPRYMAVVHAINERKQTELAFQEQLALTRAITDNSTRALFICDERGHGTFMNHAAEAVFGYTRDQIAACPVHELIHSHGDGFPPDTDCPLGRALATHTSIREQEDRFVRSTGETVPVLVSASPILRDGRLAAMVIEALDITKRKDAEAGLHQMADAMPQIVWAARPDGYLDYYNARWYESTGAQRDLGGDASWMPMLHPDDVQRTLDTWYHSIRTGEPYQIEYRLRNAQTSSYRWHLGRALPVRNQQGAIVRWFGTCTDIEEVKRAQEALSESESRLRLAMAAGKMGAWEVDLRTGETHWDAREFELTGVPPGSPIFNKKGLFYSLVYPDDLPRLKTAVLGAIQSSGGYDEEFRIRRPDGAVRWLAGKALIVADHQGQPAYLIGVNFDITDRKEAEERLWAFTNELEQRVAERTEALQTSQDRLRALATELNLAEQRERKRLAVELHDHLAQLLVLGRLKLGQAKRVPAGEPKGAELIVQTEEVLNQALAYTRTLVAELSPPVLREFGLPAALTWLGEWMQRHNLSVTVQIDLGEAAGEQGLSLPEDQAVLLFQSVRELLMNTAKHADTDRGTVRLTCQGEELCIEVADNGKGFDPAGAANERSQAAPSSGSGFGLFSVRERMQAIGGRLDVRSVLGQGTKARLRLPIGMPAVRAAGSTSRASLPPAEGGEQMVGAAGPTKASPGRHQSDKDGEQRNADPGGSERPSPVQRHGPRLRILLVDDHAMVRQGLRSLLDTYPDVEVVGEAADGEEAVASVERLHPAIVVMDINMPRQNGIDATVTIKARHPDILVIGLSVNPAGENQTAMLRAGASMLLTKEAAVDELYRAIQLVREGR